MFKRGTKLILNKIYKIRQLTFLNRRGLFHSKLSSPFWTFIRTQRLTIRIFIRGMTQQWEIDSKIVLQKSYYRQCCIPSTLKDKIVTFLLILKSSKNPLTRTICWKSLRTVQISFSWLTRGNSFIQASCWSCCWFYETIIFDGLGSGAENIYFLIC